MDEKVFEYFRKNVIIEGKHSELVDDMWEQNQIQNSYFKRLVDLYLVAATIGIRTHHKGVKDTSGTSKRTILIEQLNTCLGELDVLMKMMLLLDNTTELSVEEKVRRAFREPNTEEEFNYNVELFESYVRGGIEVLHDKLVKRGLGIEDKYTDVKIGNIVALLNDPLVPDLDL